VDRQSDAFRNAQPSDWATDTLLADAVVHEPGSLEPIAAPEDWEDREWDAGRGTPKSLIEAQALLAARIADPEAPDDETVAGAYDQLEGE
jgi:hypothetical protein